MTGKLFLSAVGILLSLVSLTTSSEGAELLVGAASADITPTGPAAIQGQFSLKIAKTVESPLTANVLALESRRGDKSLDSAVMVSLDLATGPGEVLDLVRKEVHKRLPELDVKKIFLNGTHTHTAPVYKPGKDCAYRVPKEGVVQVEKYRDFLVQRIVDAVVRAWNARAPGSVTWGLGHAVVAYNRRAVYADGTAKMYGKTDVPEFRSLEGYEDHDVGSLFFWNKDGKLVSIVVDVSCPAQEGEAGWAINADYWHPLRELLIKRYGKDVCVLGWIGAAGDQSPHLMYRKAADDRMTNLRGLTRLQEIARRIDRAVEESYEAVKNDRHANVPLIHKVETVRLPMWLVTDAQYKEAKTEYEKAKNLIAQNPAAADLHHVAMKWHENVVRRYENQQSQQEPEIDVEIHVMRIGDAVVCTNPFELYTDFGIQIKARSKAVQTFLIQLTDDSVGWGSYLPTEKAVRGGHYSAIAPSCAVGPEGGQALVDRTIELIDSLWPEPEK